MGIPRKTKKVPAPFGGRVLAAAKGRIFLGLWGLAEESTKEGERWVIARAGLRAIVEDECSIAATPTRLNYRLQSEHTSAMD